MYLMQKVMWNVLSTLWDVFKNFMILLWNYSPVGTILFSLFVLCVLSITILICVGAWRRKESYSIFGYLYYPCFRL